MSAGQKNQSMDRIFGDESDSTRPLSGWRPNPNGSVVGSGCDPAAGKNGERANSSAMALKSDLGFARCKIPDFDCLIKRTGREAAIGKHDQCGNGVVVAPQRFRVAVGNVP